MATRPTIEIRFQAKGAEGLRKTIEKLGTAQNRLNKSTNKASKTQDKFTRSQNKSTKAGTLAVRNLRNQNKSVNTLNGSFSVLRSKILLISFGFGLIAGSIGKALKMFGFQERAIAKLNAQLGFNSTKLQEQASALQQVTGVGDEVIINAQSQLAAFVRNEEAVGKLTEAALNLSVGLGIDLNSASQLLGKTIGSTTNAMSRYGISVTGAANSSDRINKAIQNTNALFGGLAKAAGEQTLGSMDKLGASFGDLIETLGELLTKLGFIQIIDTLTNAFSLLGSAVSGVANFIGFYTTAVDGGVVANNKLAKSTNKQIMAIKSLTNVEKARDYITNLEEQIKAEEERIKILNVGILATQTQINLNDANAQSTANVVTNTNGLNKVYLDLKDSVPEVNGQLVQYNQSVIDIGNKTEDLSNITAKTVINIGNSGEAFENENLQATKLNTSLGINLNVRDSQIQSTNELIRLIMLLSQAMSKENDLAAKQISQIQNRNISANNLAVAQGELTKHQAALNNLNEKRSAIREMLERGFVNEIQHTDTMNKLQLESINIENELQKTKMKTAQVMIDSMQQVTSALVLNLDKRQQAEIQSLKEETKYINASDNQKERMEEEANRKYQSKRTALFRAEQALSISEIIINTQKGIMYEAGTKGLFGLTVLGTAILAQGAISAALVAAQQPPQYEYGGMVGGQRHSAGGTLIEAEQGEFVMNRNAVDSIGVGALNAMNQSGAGVTVNVSGNVLTQDFVEGELAESIQEAVRKGVSFA